MKSILISFILFYLRFFAKRALKMHTPTVIGITGSVGKSSVRNAVYVILKEHFPTKIVKGNSETGLPLGILGLELHSLGFETLFASLLDWLRIFLLAPFSIRNLVGTKYLVVEMGIDDPYPPKNMEYLLSIIKPHIAVFLNVTPVHTMQFEKLLSEDQKKSFTEEQKLHFLLDKIAAEKAKIITQSGCSVAIINGDDKRVILACPESDPERASLARMTLTFGKEKNNTISYSKAATSVDGISFSYKTDKETIELKFPHFLFPKQYQQTFAATILVAKQTGLTNQQITDTITKHFHMPLGRSSMFDGINSSVIIDSSYNASRTAVEAFLDMVKELKTQTKREVVFVFGDMRELGNETASEHEKVAKKIIGIVDYLYCVGPLTQEYVLQVVDEYSSNEVRSSSLRQPADRTIKDLRWFANAKYAGEYLAAHMPEKSIVLVKGSQNTIFLEETIKYILKNKADQKNLCRQDDFWMHKKNAFFSQFVGK
jgi:UDP-N-acetylmuramoyl-tripeptide--D-alanyl-D-alanine ligase